MLTIEHCDTKESLKIGDLFDQIGFSSDFVATDDEGDSFIANTWPVEVLSLDSYYPVEGFRWTKLEPMVRVTHKILRTDGTSFAGKDLECSPDHIVLQQNPNNWKQNN